MSYLVIALLLFCLAIVLFLLDLMLPTGGALVAIAAVLASIAVYVGFLHHRFTGLSLMLASLVAIPLGLWAFIEIWPRTPFGKAMILTPKPVSDFNWSDSKNIANANDLVGAEGLSVDEMLPSGLVKIDGKNYEAFSESGPIEPNTKVRVIRLDVGRLVVVEARDPTPGSIPSEESALDRPASELSIDSLDG